MLESGIGIGKFPPNGICGKIQNKQYFMNTFHQAGKLRNMALKLYQVDEKLEYLKIVKSEIFSIKSQLKIDIFLKI